MNTDIKVLVADDNKVDRMLLSAIVRSQGFDTIEAVDGEDALEKFFGAGPDLVLLDVMMPGLDGLEVARRIKSRIGNEFVPIIFLTSLTEADALAGCLDAGGDDFLSKPYNRVILKAKLNAMERMRNMHRTVQQQRDEIARHHAHLIQEQEAAKAVFDKVTHSGDLQADYIQHLISPLAIFNGDVLLADRTPAGGLIVLLGDFTGHGLAAAIGAMPLADAFYSMVAKGFFLGDILRECNRKLCSVLPSGYFCCAILVHFDFRKGLIEYWNGGLPSALLVHGNGELIHLDSTYLALGILDSEKFDARTRMVEVEPGDKVFVYTDGVVEARDRSGQLFGFERLHASVVNGSAVGPFKAVNEAVAAHIGRADAEDDITMAEVTVLPAGVLPPFEYHAPHGEAAGPSQWCLEYELRGESLGEFNPLPLLQQAVMEAPYLHNHSGEIYTVLGELYSNALEHGVLGLDSSLKHNAQGFAQYYSDRAAALQEIRGAIRFSFVSCPDNAGGGELEITVTDSGRGFDTCSFEAGRSGSSQYHGRGLTLLHDLCKSVEYLGAGNTVRVVFAWSSSDA